MTSAFAHKYCINCKHFLPVNKYIFPNVYLPENEYGKCAYFVKDYKNSEYRNELIKHLVAAKPLNSVKDEYYYASTAREFPHMCGEKGKKYEPINNDTPMNL